MINVSSQPDELALWRYGIISSLLHRFDNDPPLYAMIKDLAQRTYYTPDGKQKRLSDDTIRSYLDRYKAGGIAALSNRLRNDLGGSSVPQQLQTVLIDLRKNYPHFTFVRLLRMLIQNGQWNGVKPSRSSLYRFAVANSLIHTAVEPSKPVRSFEFPFFGDLWSADFLHGPKIRQGVYLYKSYLHAIIDDRTRYIVIARFHLSENTHCLLDDFMLAIRRFGVPKRLYTDNGAAFRLNICKLLPQSWEWPYRTLHRIHHADGCVRFFKKRFEIKNAIVGTEIAVFYLPWNQDCIFIGPQKEAVKPLDTIHNALRFDKPRRGQSSTTNSGDTNALCN